MSEHNRKSKYGHMEKTHGNGRGYVTEYSSSDLSAAVRCQRITGARTAWLCLASLSQTEPVWAECVQDIAHILKERCNVTVALTDIVFRFKRPETHLRVSSCHPFVNCSSAIS